MELRRDSITQTWVIQEDTEVVWPQTKGCPLCPGQEAQSPQTIYQHLDGNGRWDVRVTPHPRPLYRIEGDAQRRAEGIYDRMRNLGAHEVVIEHPDHNVRFTQQTEEGAGQVMRAYVSRLKDLKNDVRFRYVTVFRNQGAAAGQDFGHPHSQITAAPFIPRRVGYELRSTRHYFDQRERCLVCDIVRQELSQQVRLVEWDDQFVAFCPFASRVPYETWVLPVSHHFAFEEDLALWERQLRFARFLKSVLQRLELRASDYHLVLHTAPNLNAKYEKANNWLTLPEDYHWHFEILPVVEAKSKSYVLKEVYYNSLPAEAAAAHLRKVTVESGVKS